MQSTSHVQMPHSIESEQAVLGALIFKPDLWDNVSDLLSEDHFYNDIHKLIFKSIGALITKGTPVDILTVNDEIQRASPNDEDCFTYIVELSQNTPVANNIRQYANIVHDRFVRRKVIATSQQAIESASAFNDVSAEELIAQTESEIVKIAEAQTKGEKKKTLNQLLRKTIDLIDWRHENPDRLMGINTGFDELNAKLSGFCPSDLIILAARPSMGKTALALNFVENTLILDERPVIVFSLEMPGEQLINRMVSSIGKIKATRIRDGKLIDDDWTRLSLAVNRIKNFKLHIDDEAGISPSEMRSRVRKFKREHGDVGLIMVDYLQLMQVKGSKKYSNRSEEISEISKSLKALAKEMQCPVLALSQLNRALENRPNKRPVNADLRESGAIEQDADVIMFIYRDEVYNEDSPDKGTAEIIIGKQRNGPIGTARLAFQGEYSRFENLAHGYQEYSNLKS